MDVSVVTGMDGHFFVLVQQQKRRDDMEKGQQIESNLSCVMSPKWPVHNSPLKNCGLCYWVRAFRANTVKLLNLAWRSRSLSVLLHLTF